MHMNPRIGRAFVATALLSTGLAVAVAQPATAASVTVTNGNDSGDGSFRAAVEAANGDAAVDTITFRGGIEVDLDSAVVFTGGQDLTIDGKDAVVSGATVPVDTDTWDSGLFVATGGGDLTLSRIGFADSFNNGVAVFLPDGGDDVTITLDRVTVTNTQFHGVLIDGQSTTGYNTDDIVHLGCTDPYAVDSNSSIELDVSRTTITGAGQLTDGYDTSLLTGCPQDFDGLRVDQGGEGDITGTLSRGAFDVNLADGVELDEKGDGGVDVVVERTTFNANGATEGVECTQAYLDALDLADPDEDFDRCDVTEAPDFELLFDLDDGFDIDEEDAGDLVAHVSRSEVSGNNDEGLDFDEAGDGDLVAIAERITAISNNDEAFKTSEEGEGSVIASLSRSTLVDGSDDATTFEEADGGDVVVTVERSTITGHDGDGVKAEELGDGSLTVTIDRSTASGQTDGDGANLTEEDDGTATVTVTRSSMNGNDDDGVDVEQVGAETGTLVVDRSDLTGNADDPIDDDGVTVTVTRTAL